MSTHDLLNLAILASGSGSNSEAILRQCQEGTLPARPVAVLSNNPEAFVLQRAERYGVPALVANHREYRRREDHEERIIELLQPFAVDLVVLAGYMRVVTSTLLDAFDGRWQPGLPGVMNIHPADTTRYQGAHGYEYALGLLPQSQRLKETKITVHFVDSGVDTGPIIAQQSVRVRADDDLHRLRQRGLAVEHRLYPACIGLYAQRRVRVDRGVVQIDGTRPSEKG